MDFDLKYILRLSIKISGSKPIQKLTPDGKQKRNE